ncbi:hypothetical protein HPB47_011187 [Ixodes persulcatus]|uniref:Uncharacterized protein n=1 Tax=Ixodes persulcatus TaxID=34615 RepID=A0AC60NWZ5_IXOPE|nr:hypothetical protein HPB47_011187 [Ixodes persulcatus]
MYLFIFYYYYLYFVIFSAGTTGQPKPARLSHFNVVNNANTVGRFIGYHQKREIMCLNADLIYGFGRTLGVLAATMFGSTVYARYSRCTIATGSTSLFSDIMRELEEGAYDVSSVRKAIMSGSLCNPAIVEKIRTRLNAQALYIMYGATETSPIFSSTNPDEPTDRWIRTIGTPLEHVEVARQIHSHTFCHTCFSLFETYPVGRAERYRRWYEATNRLDASKCRSNCSRSACFPIVPVNTRGELCTRGPHVFKGYLNDEAKTKEAIRDNWYHTGDEGTMHEDGRLTFVGRIKEMINFMGIKVPPLEIENILNSHPDVEESQVCFQKYGGRCKTSMSRPITCRVLYIDSAAETHFPVFTVSK